jgi:hypothetical protein
MTPDAIEITKDFPPTRERVVLQELLRVVRKLQEEGIPAVICGGWVPFLKELARHSHTDHLMSFDIDLLLRAAARERQSIDRMRLLVSESLQFHSSRDAAFRYEKQVDGNLVQLDLLADVARVHEGDSIMKFYGASSSLDLCLLRWRRRLG